METTSFEAAQAMDVDMTNVYQEEEEDDTGFTPEDDKVLQSYFTDLQRARDPADNDMEDDDVDVPEIDSSLKAYFDELQVNKNNNEPHEVEEARLASLASSRRRALPPAPAPVPPPAPAPVPP